MKASSSFLKIAMAVMTAICCHLVSSADEITSGRVVDSSGTPVEGIAVILLQLPDSTFIGGTITDPDGLFSLPHGNIGRKVVLRAEGIGYEKIHLTTESGKFTTIQIASSDINLGEVIVTHPSLQVSPGKFTFFPGDLASHTTDGFTLLKYVPLVEVDKINDAIGIIGKKTTKLTINGKEPPGGDYAATKLLQVADPSRIKRVEIILQPPFGEEDYESIVNISMTPQSGNVATTDAMFHYTNDKLSARQQLFYYGEYDRWQYSASFHANETQTKNNTYYSYTAHDPADNHNEYRQISENENTDISNWFNTSLGASLDLLHNNSLGINLTGHLKNQDLRNVNLTQYDPSGESQTVISQTKSPYRPWGNVSINYDHALDSLGSSLWAKASVHFENGDEDISYNPESDMSATHMPFSKLSYQLRANWDKVLNDRFSFTLATKFYHDRQHYRMFESDRTTLSDILTITDNFRYLQTQYDLSAGAEWDISDILGLKAGATGRWYARDINQYLQGIHNNLSDFYLLPNASISLAINPSHMLTLSYGMELTQPLYFYVNPIIKWVTTTQYYSGNPNLNPEKAHNLTFTYILLQKIVFGGIACFKSDISQIGRLPENDIIHSMPVEIGNACETNLFATYQGAFLDYRWLLYGRLDWRYNSYSNFALPASYGITSEKHSQWGLSIKNDFYLGATRQWNLSANLSYESPLHKPFYNRDWNLGIDLEVSKRFDWGGQISFSALNLLDRRPQSRYSCAAYSQWTKNTGSNRIFMIRFDFTIGKKFDQRDMSGTSGMGGN